MGRKIEIDIDDLFDILSTLEDGGHSIPMMVFDMIGDCNLNDIAKYAQTIMAQKGFIKSDYDNYKCALEGIFKAWLGKKAIEKLKDKKEKE